MLFKSGHMITVVDEIWPLNVFMSPTPFKRKAVLVLLIDLQWLKKL